jgi:type I restriction enzyme S subunit
MNLLLSTGSICDVEQRNSLEFTKKEQYDWIGTNPPFGTEIKYNKILVLPTPAADFTKVELYPCDVNDGSALFLQSCARRLKPGGICNIVLPYGEIFFGRNKFQKLREYMILNYDIRAILIAPVGIFTHTNTATAVMYFTTGKTSAITFYKTDLTCKEFKETKKLSLEELAANKYNLLLKSYDAKIKLTLIDSTWSIKKLGEVCEFLPTTKHYTSIGNETGKYRFYNSSQSENKKLYLDTYEVEHESVIINNGGGVGVYIDSKFTASKHVTVTKCYPIILPKYLYHYLSVNLHLLSNISNGSTIKWVNKTNMADIEIPICSLEKQQEIVTRYEAYDAEIKSITDGLQLAEKLKSIYDRENIADLFNTSTKKLGDVCEIKAGKFNSRDCQTEGKYPFYTGKAKNPEGFSDNYCFDYPEYLILIKGGGAGDKKYGDHIGLGKVFYVCNKSASTSNQLALIPNKELNVKYTYYYMRFIKNDIMDFAHYTTGLGSISQEAIKNIDIPTPTLERQQEIITAFEQRAVTFAALDASNAAAQQLIDILNVKKKLLFVGKA